MKIKDLRQLSGEELQLELERVQKHLFDLRSQSVTEKLEDPTMLTKAKRDMARILTVEREREIAAAAAPVDPKSQAQAAQPAGAKA
jgi:large subunit ribosomal protein L29